MPADNYVELFNIDKYMFKIANQVYQLRLSVAVKGGM